jgi:hypothetical protein
VTIQELGSIGELVAALATVATLAYLATQIRGIGKRSPVFGTAGKWSYVNQAAGGMYSPRSGAISSFPARDPGYRRLRAPLAVDPRTYLRPRRRGRDSRFRLMRDSQLLRR